MQIDCVFSGGGVKAYAFIGALKSLDAHDVKLERVAGTSAGAIIASLVAANYSIKELKDLVQSLQVNELLDPPSIVDSIPFMKWLTIYFKLGIYKGNKLEEWLAATLEDKGIRTFADIEDGHLKVVISDLSLGKLVLIPDDLERVYNIEPDSFSVARAVRMSAGFPYVFMPKYVHNKDKGKSVIVDGGLLSNFPLWVFKSHSTRLTRPQLGIKLSESSESVKPMNIKNALDMMKALVYTMKNAHDSRYINTSDLKNIIFIPVKHVKTTDFMITDEQKDRLIALGENTANEFLRTWST